MSDLISRQAAIKDAESWIAVDKHEKRLQKNVVEWLKELPSAEPRKKGNWIHFNPKDFKCSECGAYLEIAVGDVKMNFCPNCGSYNGGEQE